MAEALLAHVEVSVAQGRLLDDVLSELAPEAGGASAIEPLVHRWIEVFEKRVEVGKRQPRTLREYRRWAGLEGEQGAYFTYWRDVSIFEITTASLEEWSFWLAEHGISQKTVKNVMAGFSSFLHWIARDVRVDYKVPTFPWPEPDEHQPTIVSSEIQEKILNEIPDAKRGIFLCMAYGLVRPSEARVLRVRDLAGDSIRVSRAAKDRKTGGVVRGLKSRNAKVVPVDLTLDLWFGEYLPLERTLEDPDGPLFVNPDGRKQGWWSETALRRTWKAAAKRAGVPNVSLYEGTKHSYATHLKARGADDRLLAHLAGHRDPRSIEKYARLQDGAVRAALHRLQVPKDKKQ